MKGGEREGEGMEGGREGGRKRKREGEEGGREISVSQIDGVVNNDSIWLLRLLPRNGEKSASDGNHIWRREIGWNWRLDGKQNTTITCISMSS